MPPQILRLRRSDEDGSFVLIQVISAFKGSSELDVKILGTEGENAYVASAKRSQLPKFRASNYDGTAKEWELILSHCLLRKDGDDDEAKALEGLETVASVTDDGKLNITIRKNVGGITQRLGSIPLSQTDDEELPLFDWTGMAAQAADEARDQVTELKSKFKAQQEVIKRLNNQLEELIQAKKDHEDALLEKFKELLNSKKLKIRDQQRMLAGTKVSETTAKQVRASRQSTPPRTTSSRARPSRDTAARKPAPSRRGKRKATAEPEPEPEEMQTDSEEDAKAEREQREELAEETTPSHSDLDETEDDDEVNAAASDMPKPAKSGVAAKGKVIEKAKGSDAESPEMPPPRRELPFARRNLRSGPTEAPRPSAQDGDGGDDTTDDEL